MDWLDEKSKQRIVQELVPGKQITLAHIIASPAPVLYETPVLIMQGRQSAF